MRPFKEWRKMNILKLNNNLFVVSISIKGWNEEG